MVEAFLAEPVQAVARASHRDEDMAEKVPYFGPYEDHDIAFGADTGQPRRLVLRIWPCWAMVLIQSCELDHQDPDDSRVLVAPVVFRTKWPGDHWGPIRDGAKAGYLYLERLPRHAPRLTIADPRRLDVP